MRHLIPSALVVLILGVSAQAELPAPPAQWANWSMKVTADQPGEMSAVELLDKPAGKNGGIICRDGHFYSGDKRVRFWGVNIAFSANFPSHAQADALAMRFSRYGINAVRFHHMDNQPYPNGIFADSSLTTLSAEALDRLDYFIAALKQQGVYADLNLHVSRNYDHYHKSVDGKNGPKIDKMVDLFDPELIAAQKQYASDLLKHVNAYTHARYADEPAVGIVEINNENSLFMWGADQTLAKLPTVYSDELQRQWNTWLLKKYKTRDGLKTAWSIGEEKWGDQLLPDQDFHSFDTGGKKHWALEQHDTARMKASFDRDGKGDGKPRGAIIDVTAVDGIDWHLQVTQPGLHLKKGKSYLVNVEAWADHPMKIGVSVSQAHDPWQSAGLGSSVELSTERHMFAVPFIASIDEENARLSFAVGKSTGRIYLPNVTMIEGGRFGLTTDEDPSRNNVLMPAAFTFPPSPPRRDDWYTFLQQTEENYYLGMMNFLKTDLGVKCPITGTIGFGPMGTFTQSKMDFVDAHAYWQHPTFPHKQWDASDWTIPNTPMVDQPDHGTLWALAGTRVAGKPFTVTEYQHPAPNDYQAECIPMIATFAALQDWDGVFLFAYSHNADFEKDKISSFFDIEGNPAKMSLMPMGARLFSSIKADAQTPEIAALSYSQLLRGVPQYSFDQAGFLSHIAGFNPQLYLNTPMAISFDAKEQRSKATGQGIWSARGPGTGRFIFSDATCAAFVGFSGDAEPIDLPGSQVRIESLSSPFATIIVTPASAGQKMTDTPRLLVTAVARVQNTNMGWTPNRHSVANHWGQPPVQIEVVQARISIPGHWGHAFALDSDGRPTGENLAEIQADRTNIRLGVLPAIGYVVNR